MTSAIIQVPDIGTKDAVDIIEINVKPGDRFSKDETLIVLESDKATMEIPAPYDGVVGELKVKVGDSVKTGDPILAVAGEASASAPSVQASSSSPTPLPASAPSLVESAAVTAKPPVTTPAVAEPSQGAATPVPATMSVAAVPAPVTEPAPSTTDPVHAGPAVRRLARELGVELAQVKGSGPKGRILKEDVHGWVKARLSSPTPAVTAVNTISGSGLPELPDIDFSAFGPVETLELSRINRLSAANLHRAWLHIPHVTQFDEADVTDLEAFRKAESTSLKDQGVRLTMLAFLVKACVRALQAFPRFNSSLNREATTLTLKRYFHIGIAVDTPNGLVVPVIRDADRKSVVDIARDMQALSARARDKKLTPADMQGACFSISSLGGIGGTAFTPIVNWPEVAILGVSKMQTRPQWDSQAFVPRLMLPLSLSYDHRVIDGAEAARFTTFLSAQLADIRRLLL